MDILVFFLQIFLKMCKKLHFSRPWLYILFALYLAEFCKWIILSLIRRSPPMVKNGAILKERRKTVKGTYSDWCFLFYMKKYMIETVWFQSLSWIASVVLILERQCHIVCLWPRTTKFWNTDVIQLKLWCRKKAHIFLISCTCQSEVMLHSKDMSEEVVNYLKLPENLLLNPLHVQITFGISHQNWDFGIRRKPIFFSLSVQNFIRPKECYECKSSELLDIHKHNITLDWNFARLMRKIWAFFWYQNLSWITITLLKFRGNLVVRGHRHYECMGEWNGTI